MAKHCNVCNQEFSEDLGACPHCAAARAPRVPPGSESEINLDAHMLGGEHPSEASEHSSVVNLGQRGPSTHHVPRPGSDSDINVGPPPAGRVPDTNSGVAINRIEEPSDSSVEQWAALVQDAGSIDASGVHVDSPSDKDLLAKAASEVDSSSHVDMGVAEPAGDLSGVRISPHSEADVVLEGDSGSRVHAKLPHTPAQEPSGVRIVAKSEPDVIPADSGSNLDVLPPAVGGEESSMVNLGAMPRKKAASDLMLASDALESGTSGVSRDKSDAKRGDSGEALVELAQDSGTSNAPQGHDSASGPSSEQSGLDLTMLSGGASEGSSILPERPRRAQPPIERPVRKAAPTHHAMYEHFSDAGEDSAVQLGALPERRSEEDNAPASSHAKSEERERLEEQAAPTSRRDMGEQSGRIYVPRSRALPKVLAGAALGLVIGAGGAAGIMSMFGTADSKAKTAATAPNSNQVAGDQAGREWTDRFPGKEPNDVAMMIEQLDAAKNDAEKNAAAQGDAIKVAETKSAGLAELLKTTETKATKLAAELQTRKADLDTALGLVKEMDAAARKQAEGIAAMGKELKSIIETAETDRKTAAHEIATIKDQLKAADAKQAAAAKQVEAATTARKQAETVLNAAVQKLKDGKYLKADATSADVARAVEQVITAAKSSDPSGKMATVQAELASVQSKLAKSESDLAAARKAMQDTSRTIMPPSAEVQESNPLLAEASYMAGVQAYWSGAYERAEQQFLSAIRNDGRDARYHYYLGLTRLSLQKQSAAQHDFERGAELERQGRPSRAAVNAALERIQGSMRQTVERYRR